MMTEAQRDLADCCLYLPEGSRGPCYALAEFVVTRPSGETSSFSCGLHLEAWQGRIQGAFTVLDRPSWVASGAGYRGQMLGG